MRIKDFQDCYREGKLISLNKENLIRLGWSRDIENIDHLAKITNIFAKWIDKLEESSITSLENTTILFESGSVYQEGDYQSVIFLTLPNAKKYKRVEAEFINNRVNIYVQGELVKTLKFYDDDQSRNELVDWFNKKEQ